VRRADIQAILGGRRAIGVGGLASPSVRIWLTNVGTLVIGLVNSVVLARILEPTGRGELAAVLLWPGLLTYLASLGLMEAILFEAALPSARPGAILGNGLALATLQSAVAVPLGYVVMPLLLASQRDEVVDYGRRFLLIVPISLVTQYAISMLQGQLRFGSVNLLRLVIPIGYLASTLVLVAIDRLTIPAVVVTHLSLNSLAMGIALGLLLWQPDRISLSVEPGLARTMVRYGLKVHVGSISSLSNVRLDQLLMAAWSPAAQLGIYAAAVGAAGVTQTVSHAVRTVLTPQITRETDRGRQVILLESVFRRYWWFTLAITPVFGLALWWALPLVYGESFRPAVWTAEVLLLGTLSLGAKEVLAAGARALDQPWMSSRAEVVGLVVTLVLLPILLPTMGILGAAVASLAAYTTALVVLAISLRRGYAVSFRSLFGLGAAGGRG